MTRNQPKIIIKSNVLKNACGAVKPFGGRFAIVTDSNIKKLGQELYDSLRRHGLKCNLIILPPGEQTKSISFVEKLSHTLLQIGLKRDGCLIALGGGVIGDLAGFVASIYMRGINFISIPTTLLAMTDSCVGGKTGIDLAEGKNLLGTFYNPKAIIIDPLILKNLPEKAFRTGMAEVIKHGIIADRTFFTSLEKNAAAILRRSPPVLKKVIEKSIHIKLKIVSKDEKESVQKSASKSSRMLLNYGHTVGHALERLSGYSMPHGDAIAIGMVAENRIAVARKLMKESEANRIINLLKRFNLPTKIPAEYSAHAIKKALNTDKKNIGEKLHFALPVGIGKAKIMTI